MHSGVEQQQTPMHSKLGLEQQQTPMHSEFACANFPRQVLCLNDCLNRPQPLVHTRACFYFGI